MSRAPVAGVVRAVGFGPAGGEMCETPDAAALDGLQATWPLLWIDVDGPPEEGVIATLAARFGLHPLAVEDVVHGRQRAKVERYESGLFVVIRALTADAPVDTEQVALFLGARFVLTFQECAVTDTFSTVRARLLRAGDPLHGRGADHLAYELIDGVIDAYFPAVEAVGDRLALLERRALDETSPGVLRAVYETKRDILALRHALWPMREAVHALARTPSDLVGRASQTYLGDTYDHILQILDWLESDRETVTTLVDIYLSNASYRMNEVIRFLTVVSTVFIPITFLTSVYGMNFDRSAGALAMPELGVWWGYPTLWLVMIVLTLVQLLLFHRKGWLLPKPWTGAPPADADPPTGSATVARPQRRTRRPDLPPASRRTGKS